MFIFWAALWMRREFRIQRLILGNETGVALDLILERSLWGAVCLDQAGDE